MNDESPLTTIGFSDEALHFDGFDAVKEVGRIKITFWRHASGAPQEQLLQISVSNRVARGLGEVLEVLLGGPGPIMHGNYDAHLGQLLRRVATR